MIKIVTINLIFIFSSCNLLARNAGETEITTDEGIEVFQNEKFYLLKKNVKIISDTFSLSGDIVKVFFNKDLYDITTIFADGKVILNAESSGFNAEGNSMEIFLNDEKIIVIGLNSKLNLESTIMLSDGTIEVSNQKGIFILIGPNSSISSEGINVIGKNIDGQFSTINENKEVISLAKPKSLRKTIKTFFEYYNNKLT